MNEKIALIDLDSILHSAFYGNKVADPITGEPQKVDGKFIIIPKTEEEIQESLDGILHHIFKEGEFTHYIAFVKGDNTIKDRLEINPDYKQHRVINLEQKKLFEFTKQYAIERWGASQVDDIEVDDAVRIASKKISNSHIVAIDKDLLWLEGINFNWRKNEWINVTKVEEDAYLAQSMIIGDTVDNIKGLPGKGESYCKKNRIYDLIDTFEAYIKELGLEKGIDEFYKNFKCLYILEESDKYTEIPTPIKIELDDNREDKRSRSTSGDVYNP